MNIKSLFLFLLFPYYILSQNSCPGNYNSNYINAQPVNNPPYKVGWHIIHDEEFDNVSDIDNNFWRKWHGNWDNSVFFLPSNIVVNNGRCNLNVNYAPNSYTDWTGTRFYWYTSAYMNSKQEYGPGHFWEMKGKRNDLGFKSSFWSFNYQDANGNPLMDTLHPEYGEGISVFDNDFRISSDLNTNFSEVFGAYNHKVGCQEKTYFNQTTGFPQPVQCCMPLPNATDHTYSLDYQNNEVKIYINNKLIVKNTTNVPQSTQSMGFWITDIYWDGVTLNYGSQLEMDYVRLYKRNESISYPINGFCFNQGWTNQNTRPRFIADFNADGKKEILGFGYQHVKVSQGQAGINTSFSSISDVISNQYTVEQGWTNQNERPRLIGDINGDGKSDIIGFGYYNTIASLSNSTNSISFLPIQYVAPGYTQEQGWNNQDQTPRFLADVNGDGMDDIVGFTNDGVYISISNCTGNTVSFTNSANALSSFCNLQGWTSQNTYPRFLADVDGDGRKDIVGFGDNTTYVSLSQCFGNTLSFASPVPLYNDFCYAQGYPNQALRPRYLADINGDKKDDIIGFGYNNVYASLSNCNGSNVSFSPPTSVISHFTIEQGYLDTDQNPRFVCDINNDGKADIIGFNKEIMQVAVSKSDQNTPSFYNYNNCVDDESDVLGNAWGNNSKNKKELIDINGDGSLDVVGYGNDNVTTTQSPGGTYNLPFTVISSNKTTSNSWDTPTGLDGRDCSFKFYISEETDLDVTTCFAETDFWETITIYDINGNSIAYSDPGKFNTNCIMIPTLQPGYYYIVIDGYRGATGNFKLQVNGTKHTLRKNQHLNEESTNEVIESADIEVYPNPNDGTFNVKVNQETFQATLEIIDSFGKVIEKVIVNEAQTEIKKDLGAGVYFIKITDKKNAVAVKKIVILK